MDFVVPLLNEGLVYLLIKVYTYKSKVEVAHILPDDPVEFLSEYLYKKSFEVDKEWFSFIWVNKDIIKE